MENNSFFDEVFNTEYDVNIDPDDIVMDEIDASMMTASEPGSTAVA